MSELNVNDYITEFKDLVETTRDKTTELNAIKDACLEIQKQGKKLIIIGNGGSAAIASHVGTDLTKNAKVRTVNFNESSLLTCFTNDYGYENCFSKAVDYYGDPGDALIAISSSGQSNNIINACQIAKEKAFSRIITLSGFKSDNPLRSCGTINLWADSNSYNMVENIHQFWLLTVVDMLIGKSEYTSNR